jgi:hypothetical protein
MECDGPGCDIDQCVAGCSIACRAGRTCRIGECTQGSCHIGPSGSAAGTGASTMLIEDCAGGRCTLECGAGDSCTIGPCPGGACVIACAAGATCNCSDDGCTVETL